jgi:hypothetical protein
VVIGRVHQRVTGRVLQSAGALGAHGHTHDSFDYQVGNCRVVCNLRGYVAWTGKMENRDFDAGFVVEV